MSIKEARPWLIVTVLLSVPAAFLLIASTIGPYLGLISDRTHSLVRHYLIFQLLSFAIIIGLIVIKLGRFRPRDVGLVPANLGVGLSVMVLAWAVGQIVVMAIAIATTGALSFDERWTSGAGIMALTGAFVGNLLGTALCEETIFRGFLLPQFFLKLRRQMRGRVLALTIALLLSALCFSLVHLPPVLLQKPSPTAERIVMVIAITTCGGLYGGLLYIRTQNLFVVMGLHALFNAPTTLVQCAEATPKLVSVAIGVIAILVWPRLEKMAPILRSRLRWTSIAPR